MQAYVQLGNSSATTQHIGLDQEFLVCSSKRTCDFKIWQRWGTMELSINIYLIDGENVNVRMELQTLAETLGTHRLQITELDYL